MIFDLKSGKRRKVVQVVFGMLAFIFFISFVGFGVGTGGGIGGIFDAIGLGGGNTSSSDPQFDQQISDAQDAIAANPKSGTGYADLIAAYYGSATSSGVSSDQQTGQVSISDDAHTDLQKAAQAWDDYVATKPPQKSVQAAAAAVQVFQLLNEASGAAEAQRVIADEQGTSAAFGQLAFYLVRGPPDQGGRRRGEEGRERGRRGEPQADPEGDGQLPRAGAQVPKAAAAGPAPGAAATATGRRRAERRRARQPVRQPRQLRGLDDRPGLANTVDRAAATSKPLDSGPALGR